MLSLLLYALLALVAVGVLFAVAVLLLPSGTRIAATSPDQPPVQRLPEERLDSAAVQSVRLPVALRGYRFAETDLLLSRLATELAERDDELARLRGEAERTVSVPVGADSTIESAPADSGRAPTAGEGDQS